MVAGILNGLADPRRLALALRIEARLGDRGLGDEETSIVYVIIHAALNGPGEGAHEDAMPLGGFDIEPDIREVGGGQARHGDMAKDDLAVGGGRPGGGEGAAMFGPGLRLDTRLRVFEDFSFQSGRQRASASSSVSISIQELSATMSTRSIGRAEDACPRRAGSARDAFHFFEKFRDDAPQKEGIDQPARVVPRLALALDVPGLTRSNAGWPRSPEP